jgi:hypothetical protein
MQNETKINGIPLLCNPIGYPEENFNVNFNKQFLFE